MMVLLELIRSFACLQFKQISQAYEVLSNPEKRSLYDQGGEQALKEGGLSGGGSFSSPMDIFDMFFHNAPFGGGSRRRERRGKDVVHQLQVSLEDLYKGATRKLALEKNSICEKCEGTYRADVTLYTYMDKYKPVSSTNLEDFHNFGLININEGMHFLNRKGNPYIIVRMAFELDQLFGLVNIINVLRCPTFLPGFVLSAVSLVAK